MIPYCAKNRIVKSSSCVFIFLNEVVLATAILVNVQRVSSALLEFCRGMLGIRDNRVYIADSQASLCRVPYTAAYGHTSRTIPPTPSRIYQVSTEINQATCLFYMRVCSICVVTPLDRISLTPLTAQHSLDSNWNGPRVKDVENTYTRASSYKPIFASHKERPSVGCSFNKQRFHSGINQV